MFSLFPRETSYQLISVLLISSSSLIYFRAFCSTAGTPVSIILDTTSNVFCPSSYLETHREEEGHRLVLDTVISYSLLHTLVICTWWSCWELENEILQHCEIVIRDIKAWDSVVLAVIFSVIVFSLNTKVKEYFETAGRFRHILFYSMAFLSFLASLNYWRGLWSLMDFYFFPTMDITLNLALSHVVGFTCSFIAGTGLTLTQSTARDPTVPEFNNCQYWSYRESGEELEPTERTPIIVRETQTP